MGKKSDAIIDRDISLWQVYGSGAELLFGGVPLQLTIPPWTPTCVSRTHTTHLFPNCSTWKGCPLWKEWNSISDLSLDDRIYSALQFRPKHRCQNTFLEVIGRTIGREGRQKEGGGALFHHWVMSSSGPGRCFLIFSCRADKWLIVSLDKGTVFW